MFLVGCTIILGVTIAIPICMIVMGSIYLHECPQGEYIPVYLLVGGIFGILKQLLHLSARVRERQEDRDAEHLRQSPTQALLNCFMLGWFIIGILFYNTFLCMFIFSKIITLQDLSGCTKNLNPTMTQIRKTAATAIKASTCLLSG